MSNRKLVGRVVVVTVVTLALVPAAYASERHQPKAAAAQSHQKLVSYAPDGAPIATGAPRRLSALAMGGSAWAAYHETHGKRHRQQIAN